MVKHQFTYFVYVKGMLLKKFENKTPLKITHYTVRAYVHTVLLKGNVTLARYFYARASNARRSCLAILAYVTCIQSASVE